MKRYEIVGRSPLTSNEQAQRVGHFLETKFGVDGTVTPEQYVAAAKPARSPIHDTLTWDDVEAARQHRLDQARSILRSIVVVTDESHRVQPRAYHNVVVVTSEGAHRAYVPEHVVWRREDLAEQVVAQALAMLRAFKEKHSAYRGKLEVLRAALPHIEEAIKELEAHDVET